MNRFDGCWRSTTTDSILSGYPRRNDTLGMKGAMATSTATSSYRFVLLIGLGLASLNLASPTLAQSAPAQVLGGTNNSPNANDAPLTLSLQDAIKRAQKINPEYRLAVTDFGLAKEDRVQTRAALLPNVNYNAAFFTRKELESRHRPRNSSQIMGCTNTSARAMFIRIFRWEK